LICDQAAAVTAIVKNTHPKTVNLVTQDCGEDKRRGLEAGHRETMLCETAVQTGDTQIGLIGQSDKAVCFSYARFTGRAREPVLQQGENGTSRVWMTSRIRIVVY
jgi:hypothetical protein